MIASLCVDAKHLYGTPAEKAQCLPIFGGRSARHAMQTLGTEWGRECIGPDFWCRAWLATLPDAPAVIADDVRFANEARAVLDRGGVIIRIIRSEYDLQRTPLHASEDFAALPFTFQIVNDKCPTILQRRLVEGLQAVRTVAAE